MNFLPTMTVCAVIALTACAPKVAPVKLQAQSLNIAAAEASGPEVPGNYAVIVDSGRLTMFLAARGCGSKSISVTGAEAFEQAMVASLDTRFDQVTLVKNKEAAASYDATVFVYVRKNKTQMKPELSGFTKHVVTADTTLDVEMFFAAGQQSLFTTKHTTKSTYQAEPGELCTILASAAGQSLQEASAEMVRYLSEAAANAPKVRAFGAARAGS